MPRFSTSFTNLAAPSISSKKGFTRHRSFREKRKVKFSENLKFKVPTRLSTSSLSERDIKMKIEIELIDSENANWDQFSFAADNDSWSGFGT